MVRILKFIDKEGEKYFPTIGFDDKRNYIVIELLILLNQLKPYSSSFKEEYISKHN